MNLLVLLLACDPIVLDTSSTDTDTAAEEAEGTEWGGLTSGELVVPAAGEDGTMGCIGSFSIEPTTEGLRGSATCQYVVGASDDRYDLTGDIEGNAEEGSWTAVWDAVTNDGYPTVFEGAGVVTDTALSGTFVFEETDQSITVELEGQWR